MAHFFFEDSVSGNNYLHLLQSWLEDRFAGNEDEGFIFQQDGAPPRWKLSVRGDGHDKLFCTRAITIIDNFKSAQGDTDKR